MIEVKNIKKKVEQFIANKCSKAKINHLVALWLIQNFNFRCVMGTAKKDPMYVYEGGMYVDEGEILINKYCEKILDIGCDNNSVNQIVQKVKRLTECKRKNMGCKDLDLICLKDCVLNIRTKKVFDHSPDFGFMSKLPLTYDVNANCPKFEQWLSEVLKDEDLLTCQEWFGFMLYRRYFEKTSLVLIGPKDSGKTVMLLIMKAFIGDENKSEVDMHDMITNRFATNGLVNKLLNTNDELDGRDLKSTVMYKRMVGGSEIPAEAKNQTPYKFINHAKLVFATNQMPLPSKLDDPSAYFNKFTTFEFDNTFAKDDPNTDKFLIDKLTSDEEMSGVLNWAVDGLIRLLKQGKFSKCQDWRDVEAIMKRTGRDITQFEVQCCSECNGSLVPKQEMFDAFTEFCKLNDWALEYDLQSFGRKFKPSYVINRNAGKRERMGWYNIKLHKEKLITLD